jgi:hypothetical protein
VGRAGKVDLAMRRLRIDRLCAGALIGSAAVLLLASCGATSQTHSAAPRIVIVDRPAPGWLARELRHTYEPIAPCARPCSPVLRQAHDHVVMLHRKTVLAKDASPRAVAEATLTGGRSVTFYLYRTETGQLCDYVSVASGSRPISGSLTPGLPCVPGAPCGAICLTQLHCCGANVIVGTVTARATELGMTFGDDNSSVRVRLDQPRLPGRPKRRLFVYDLRHHGYGDPIGLFANGKRIATASVSGLG